MAMPGSTPQGGLDKVVAEMEFNVLGPLLVTQHRKSLSLGGQKQRTVLAMLIAHLGRPLTAESIAQAV